MEECIARHQFSVRGVARVNTLASWLDRATRGLSTESRAKVRAEIEEHYHAALEEPGATEQSAMLALGDPKTANCQYRKALLTSAEARLLRESAWESTLFCNSPRSARFFLPLIMFAVAMYFLDAGQFRMAGVFAWGGAGITLLMVARWLPIYTPARGRIFRIVRWTWMLGTFFIAGFGTPLMWALFPTLVWVPFYYETTLSSIRRKLPVEQWPKSLYL